jgi:hypothetical protein
VCCGKYLKTLRKPSIVSVKNNPPWYTEATSTLEEEREQEKEEKEQNNKQGHYPEGSMAWKYRPRMMHTSSEKETV